MYRNLRTRQSSVVVIVVACFPAYFPVQPRRSIRTTLRNDVDDPLHWFLPTHPGVTPRDGDDGTRRLEKRVQAVCLDIGSVARHFAPTAFHPHALMPAML
jgi:hypothetical protein